LLEAIENTDIKRYRLGSLNPLEISSALLDFLSKSDKFCPHFHLSLQSLDDSVLKAMNRHYSAQTCLDLTEEINGKFKLPFLGSDIIAGFPGETEENFVNTLKNTEKSGLSSIHVFPYSVRNNTKAAKMDNHIPEKIKRERADAMHKIANEKFNSFLDKNLNTTAQVLIEKRPDKKNGLLKGVTGNYLNVFLDSTDKELCNTIQNVKILKREDDKLFCGM
jgi:threonylcarbamoyladenosine tRNA methylthiotransferase MtaB